MAALTGLAALCAVPVQAGPAAADDGPGAATPPSGVQERQGNGDSIEPGGVYSGELGPSGGGPGERHYVLDASGSSGHSTVSVSVTAAAPAAVGAAGGFGINVTMEPDRAGTTCDDSSGSSDGGGSVPQVTVVATCPAADLFTVRVVRIDSNDSIDHLDLRISPAYDTPSGTDTDTAAPAPPPGPGATSGPQPPDTGGDTGAAPRGQDTQPWELVAATAFGTGTVLLVVFVLWTVLARRHARTAGS